VDTPLIGDLGGWLCGAGSQGMGRGWELAVPLFSGGLGLGGVVSGFVGVVPEVVYWSLEWGVSMQGGPGWGEVRAVSYIGVWSWGGEELLWVCSVIAWIGVGVREKVDDRDSLAPMCLEMLIICDFIVSKGQPSRGERGGEAGVMWWV